MKWFVLTWLINKLRFTSTDFVVLKREFNLKMLDAPHSCEGRYSIYALTP